MKLRKIVITVGGALIACYLIILVCCAFYSRTSHMTVQAILPDKSLVTPLKPSTKATKTEDKDKTLHFEGLHANPTMEE